MHYGCCGSWLVLPIMVWLIGAEHANFLLCLYLRNFLCYDRGMGHSGRRRYTNYLGSFSLCRLIRAIGQDPFRDGEVEGAVGVLEGVELDKGMLPSQITDPYPWGRW